LVVGGEEAITDLAVEVFGTNTPIQRYLFHLERQTRWMARYLGRLDVAAADELLTDAYATGDLSAASPDLRPRERPRPTQVNSTQRRRGRAPLSAAGPRPRD